MGQRAGRGNMPAVDAGRRVLLANGICSASFSDLESRYLVVFTTNSVRPLEQRLYDKEG